MITTMEKTYSDKVVYTLEQDSKDPSLIRVLINNTYIGTVGAIGISRIVHTVKYKGE